MCDCGQDEFKRMVIKIAEGVPTIPPSDDHRNGDWPDTAIYIGEFYQDSLTGKIYNRTIYGIAESSGDLFTADVVIPLADIVVLHTTPYILVTEIAGVAFQVVDDPLLYIEIDGTPFSISGFGSLEITNSSSISPLIASFPASNINTSASRIFTNTIQDAVEILPSDITISSTSAITGGGANAYFRVRFTYRVIEYF